MAAAPGRWRKRTWVLVALATIAVGVAEGYFARRQYEARQTEVFEGWSGRLAQAAGDHARLIGSWAAGVLADAQVMASYPSIVELLADAPRQAIGDQVPGARTAHVADIIGSFIRLQHYLGACLVDKSGRPIVVIGRPLAAELTSRIRGELLVTGAQGIDLFLSDGRPLVVAAVRVPFEDSAVDSTGFVLLSVEPRAWLFPEVLGDPLPGRTAEILLLREDGGRSVLLSPPREFVRPVPTHAFPRVRVPSVTGSTAMSEEDHRGVPVIAIARAVPGTPWTVVAKIDRAEVAREFQHAARSGLLQSGTLIVLLLAIVLALLNRRQAVHAAEQLKTTRQIAFLNRLLLTLSEVNELMVREKDRQRLLGETCRIIVENGGFRMAWVGEARPEAQVVALSSAGVVDGYLDGIDIRCDDSPAGRGPMGTAVRERRSVAVDDVASDPLMARWRERALKRGYASAVAVPLIADDQVWGAVMVYSEERGIFHREALALLERLASNLAFALDVIERQARHLETERALSQRDEQLRQAQKMEAVGRLAGGVAHDFNNLLMAISGYAELALSARTEEVRRERIQEIAVAADRAASLTRQLLAFSRKQVLQPKVLNLNSVVVETEKMLGRLIGDNIELVTRLEPALANVRADPGQMEQVLVNLAVNGRDAMPDGGRLVIGTRNVHGCSGDGVAGGELEPGDYVELSVTDAGEGMAPDVLDRLFEPFFTTKQLGKGTGLGLSTVYGIVKQSGGAITVESTARIGTTFRVYLPVAAEGEEATEIEATTALPSAGGERLLVVEDNAAVRSFVTEALRTTGYQVLAAESAEAALDALATSHAGVDLLLTDIVLPKMDGYELSRLAVAAFPSMKVLYMSGYNDNPRFREAAMEDGIDLIEKPFTSAAVAVRVREILDRA